MLFCSASPFLTSCLSSPADLAARVRSVPQSSVRTRTRTGEGTAATASSSAAAAAATPRGTPAPSSGGARAAAFLSTCCCCCRCSASARPPSSPGSPFWVRTPPSQGFLPGSCWLHLLPWSVSSRTLQTSTPGLAVLRSDETYLSSSRPSRNLVCDLPDHPGHHQSCPPWLPPGLPLVPGLSVLRSR